MIQAYEFAFLLGETNTYNSYSFGFTTSATSGFTELPDGVYFISCNNLS